MNGKHYAEKSWYGIRFKKDRDNQQYRHFIWENYYNKQFTDNNSDVYREKMRAPDGYQSDGVKNY